MEKEMEKEIEERRFIFGWEDAQGVANSVWGTIHDTLLRGDLVFAYRNLATQSKKASGLYQLVVSQNFDIVGDKKLPLDDFNVGYVVVNSYTALLSHMPLKYLEGPLYDDMKNWKLEEEILKSYKDILNYLQNGRKD